MTTKIMKRRSFIKSTAAAIITTGLGVKAKLPTSLKFPFRENDHGHTRSHWPSPCGSFPGWKDDGRERDTKTGIRHLSELVERGYDAVRIDAFPHLIAAGPKKIRKLIPHWDNQCWGSPYYTEVQVQPSSMISLENAATYGVRVALSTWWREDSENLTASIKSGRDLGLVWKKTLDSINEAGLLDNIIYVDLSNEYAIDVWTPYLPKNTVKKFRPGDVIYA